MSRYIVLIFTCLALASCREISKPFVADRETAIYVVQHDLSVHGKVAAQTLQGGFSAKLFLVTTPDKKYVVRFLQEALHQNPNEIACLQIASRAGYGPHVYSTDREGRYVVMEYINSRPITKEDRNSAKFYRALGDVLYKIHHGQDFPEKKEPLEWTKHDLVTLSQHESTKNIAARIQMLLPIVERPFSAIPDRAPCHNDLNPGNLLYTGDSFKVIDFETAGQSNPYFDIATVIQFYCLTTKDENELLNAYFSRALTKEEAAKLFISKQASRLWYAAVLLAILPEVLSDPNLVTESYEEFVKKDTGKKFDVHRLALHFYKLANHDIESPDFEQAIDTLKTSSSAQRHR